jgi:EpsI family protein
MSASHLPVILPRTGWRGVLLALALCVTAAAGQWWQHAAARITSPPPPDLAQMIPEHFAGWREDNTAVARPISPAAAAKADALYARTMERVYVDAEQRRIMLSISYGSQQGDGLQAHRPEFCYQAQGFAIGAIYDGTLETVNGPLPLRRLEARRPGRTEPVSYWLTVGDDAALPGLSRKLAQLRKGVSGQAIDGLLIRVSSISESRIEAFAIHDIFINDLLAAVPTYARIRLAGRSGPS